MCSPTACRSASRLRACTQALRVCEGTAVSLLAFWYRRRSRRARVPGAPLYRYPHSVTRGAGKNRVTPPKCPPLLDILLSHRGPKGTRPTAPTLARGRPGMSMSEVLRMTEAVFRACVQRIPDSRSAANSPAIRFAWVRTRVRGGDGMFPDNLRYLARSATVARCHLRCDLHR